MWLLHDKCHGIGSGRQGCLGADLEDLGDARVGDARKLVREIKEPVDFLFIDCNYSNYKPCLAGIEDRLTEITQTMQKDGGEGSEAMLGEITALAAELEAGAAASLYRHRRRPPPGSVRAR